MGVKYNFSITCSKIYCKGKKLSAKDNIILFREALETIIKNLKIEDLSFKFY